MIVAIASGPIPSNPWVYFLNQQRGFSILNDLGVGVIEITIAVCIAVLGGPTAHSCDFTTIRPLAFSGYFTALSGFLVAANFSGFPG